jgi:very-short-patch-repair endonuclease
LYTVYIPGFSSGLPRLKRTSSMHTRRKPPGEGVDITDRHAAADARRLAPTLAEAELERILRALGGGALAGEFRREWPVGDWTLDFYFPTVRLAIEVDGGYHRAQRRWRLDLTKTRDLEARGITVLRLANAEVFGDRERLVARLRAAWRAALQNVRRNPLTLREAEAPPYWRVALSAADILSILQGSPRELGEPLALS